MKDHARIFKSRPRRFSWSWVAFCALVLLLDTGAFWMVCRKVAQSRLMARGHATAKVLAYNAEDALLTNNRLQLELYVKSTSRVPGVAFAFVEDPQGRILAREGDSGREMTVRAREPIQPQGTAQVIGSACVDLDPSYPDPRADAWLREVAAGNLLLLALVFGALWLAWASREKRLREEARVAARKESLIEWLQDWDEEGTLHLSIHPMPGRPKKK